MRTWFDAHLDLACLAECGRDMTRGPEDCGGPWPPAAVTFPSLREGGVAACLGTIFTEADGDDAVRYPAGDAEAAHAAGLRQLERYECWAGQGLFTPGFAPAAAARPLRLGILMECADPIRRPEELGWWAGRGVIAIGMAWARGSRYASGNGEPSCSSTQGLSPIGRELAVAMDALGLVHDVSHLSDRALDDLLALTRGRIMASHSNCRSLLDGKSQRHLTDEAIREIGRRGGVIGLNLYAPFVRAGLANGERPAIEDATRHVERIAELMGHQRGVGLGSDMDGGFGATRLPIGIERPRDLERLAESLRSRGWSDVGVHAFVWGNWARFWGLGV